MIITIDTDKPLDPIDMQIVAKIVLRAVTEAHQQACHYVSYAEAALRDEAACDEAKEDERRIHAAVLALRRYIGEK